MVNLYNKSENSLFFLKKMEISVKKMFAEDNFSSPQKNNGPSLTGSCRLGNYSGLFD